MMTRRSALAALAAALMVPRPARAQSGVSRAGAFAFSFKGLDGTDIRLALHAGKPILVVNTASLCGFTPQFAGLQQLWSRYRERGLLIVGVPSNDFNQEPGASADIRQVAHQTYGVSFPLTEKVAVKGAGAHPFYKWAAAERPLEAPRWNFHKYLVGRDGHLKAGFTSAVEPSDARLIASIEGELARD